MKNSIRIALVVTLASALGIAVRTSSAFQSGRSVPLPTANLASERVSLDSAGAQILLEDALAMPVACQKNNAHPTGSVASGVLRAAWVTTALDVDSGQPNGGSAKLKSQLYLHTDDGVTKTTVMVSASNFGVPTPNGFAEMPRLTADGDWLVFTSHSKRMLSPPADFAQNYIDIFSYHVPTDTTQRVSRKPDGTGGNGNSGGVPGLSPDGRYIVFMSEASDLELTNPAVLTGDPIVQLYLDTTGTGKKRAKRVTNVFLTDRIDPDALVLGVPDQSDDVTEWISYGLDTTGMTTVCTQPDGPSSNPTVDMSGDLVVFTSEALNLLPSGPLPPACSSPCNPQVFLHDRVLAAADFTTGRTLISRDYMDPSMPGDGVSSRAKISANGLWVVFDSSSTNLVAGDTNGSEDIFVYDVTLDTVSRLTPDVCIGPDCIKSIGAEISDDGRFVVYTRADISVGTVLSSNVYELWLIDRDDDGMGIGVGTPMTKKLSTTPPVANADADGWSGGWPFGLTGDGAHVFFMSIASDLSATTDDNAMCTGCGGNPTKDCDEGRDIYHQPLF